MRIATWNINGTRARLDFVLHWLRARRPDVVGLQELKLEDDKFPHMAFEAEGYRVATHGQKSWNGVAVVTRDGVDVTATQIGLPGQEELGARLITARVDGLSFTSIYVPNGKSVDHTDFARKLIWLDVLVTHLEKHQPSDEAAVVGGDFNLVPAPIDSWSEERLGGGIFHTEAERARFQRLLDLGWVDLFRHARPDDPSHSWWDYRAGAFHKGLGLRIDFLLGTRSVVERLKSVTIDRDYRKKKDGLTASDHAPVVADLV